MLSRGESIGLTSSDKFGQKKDPSAVRSNCFELFRIVSNCFELQPTEKIEALQGDGGSAGGGKGGKGQGGKGGKKPTKTTSASCNLFTTVGCG